MPVCLLNCNLSAELLLMMDANDSHYVYVKDFHRFIYNKTAQEEKTFL